MLNGNSKGVQDVTLYYSRTRRELNPTINYFLADGSDRPECPVSIIINEHRRAAPIMDMIQREWWKEDGLRLFQSALPSKVTTSTRDSSGFVLQVRRGASVISFGRLFP